MASRTNNMLKLRNTILLGIMMLTHKCRSQSYVPLYPCYSVHKIQITNSSNSVHYYRFLGDLVLPSDDSGVDCIFTIEGPPGSSLQLQLHNVVLQRIGYVSSSLIYNNCYLGLIQIYNLTANGDLVQAQKVCGSFMDGPLIVSDTNIAVVTTTAAQGHFDLHVTILSQNTNPALRSDTTQDLDNTRVIVLGYEHEALTEDSHKSTQEQVPQLSAELAIKNVNISTINSKVSNAPNQIIAPVEETEEGNRDSQDDSLNYIEYDYDYEPDEQQTPQEEFSDEEEKLPLEKLFDLRENSKYAIPNQLKRKTSHKIQKQFVHKSNHHNEPRVSSSTIKPPRNETRIIIKNMKHNNIKAARL